MEREQLTHLTPPPQNLPGSYLDLPAVIGGAVVAAGAAGVFTTFGGVLGLSTLSAEPGSGSGTMWVVITALWALMTVVFSFGAGGYVTGRLRRRVDQANADEVAARDGLNGLVVWGLGILVMGWMAAGAIGGIANMAGTAVSAAGSVAGSAVSAAGSVAGSAVSAVGSAVGGTLQGVGAVVGGAAQGAGAAAGDEETSGLMTYLNDTLLRPAATGVQQSNGMNSPTRPADSPQEVARQSGVILGNVLRTGEISDEDRQFLTALVAQQTGLSQREVEARVDATVTKVQETRAEAERLAAEAQAEAERLAAEAKAEAERLAAEAKQAAIDAAETARKSAILTAFLITAAALAAAAAALIGGITGGRHRDEGRLFGGFGYR